MRLLILSIGLLALAGCDRSDEDEGPVAAATAVASAPSAAGEATSAPATARSATPTADAPTHRYSPFAIRLDGHRTFDVVTFKDVSRPLPDPALQTDELMAEAFAIALRRSHPGLMTEVVHEPALLDPSNHVFCDQRHLYVDFWQSSVEKWGYSLWSGCGEDDRFAWQELDGPAAYDLAAQIDRVVEHMSHRLRVADTAACHQRRC